MDKTYFWNCWELVTENGRQTWHFKLPKELHGKIVSEDDWEKSIGKDFLAEMDKAFAFDKKTNPNSGDCVFRWQKELRYSEEDIHNNPVDDPIKQVAQQLKKGWSYYFSLQQDDGNWAGDYGGPLFLVPGLVIASYITASPFDKPTQVLIKRNIWNHQNDDNGWGLHIEGHSTMFGTVMQYVTLRILGEELSNPQLKKAQDWILQHGGAEYIPQWGKFYLSLLNIYKWEGNDALLPELWKLPKWIPFHPGKYWCHNRMIFLPMSYCFGEKIKAKSTPLITALRKEIYTTAYHNINWKKSKQKVCKTDSYKPISGWYKFLSKISNKYEKFHLKKFRNNALKYTMDYINHEDDYTHFIDIGPVNQAINSIAVWYKYGGDSLRFKAHQKRWKDYLWLAEDGIKMNGYNGSQLWDTAFAGQAVLEANLEYEFPESASNIYQYLDKTQIDRNGEDREKYWQDITIGSWPFSTNEHGWAITDCTSEGLKTVLLFNECDSILKSNKIGLNRLKPAVDWLLTMQNKDGGWASYEKQRAPKWIESLNPAVLFENIMTELTYTECSSAVIQGLVKFTSKYNYRKKEIVSAVKNGKHFLRSKQNQDGSWYGSWAVCFTYGTWFGVEGLIASGADGYENNQPDNAIRKACEFLLNKQREDGSWGESFASCVEHKYIEHENGQIINTAWALLTLMKVKYPNKKVIEKGIRFLLSRQKNNGDFPQEGISGIFNGNCAISYTAYRNIFPLWALARYTHMD